MIKIGYTTQCKEEFPKLILTLESMKHKVLLEELNLTNDIVNNSNIEKDIIIASFEQIDELSQIAPNLRSVHALVSFCLDADEQESTDAVLLLEAEHAVMAFMNYLHDYELTINDQEEMTPIQTSYLKEFNYQASFYKKENDQFELLVNDEDDCTQMIEKWKKEFKFIYVIEDDFDQIVENLQLDFDLNSLDHLSPIDKKQALKEYVSQLGFDNESVEKTMAMQSELLEDYDASKVKLLIQKFDAQEGSFIYNHSFLTAVICQSVSEELEWVDKETIKRVILGCMLHDIGHKKEEIARIELMPKEERKKKLTPEQLKEYQSHVSRLTPILENIRELNVDTLSIIKDHHGQDGKESFPRQIGAQYLSLPLALFMLSHSFTLSLYKVFFKEEKIPAILAEMEEQYNSGTFTKITPIFIRKIREIYHLDITKKTA